MMDNIIIQFLYNLIRYPFRITANFRKKLFNFILPNLKALVKKKIIYQSCPQCNQKTIITGAGLVDIGKNCTFGYRLGGYFYNGLIEIQPRYIKSRIKLGNGISTNNNIFLCAANLIEIGNDTLIGQYVTIIDHEAHGIPAGKRREIGEIGEVIIGKNVWIGNNVTILKNSHIGDNSIVAAGAVVNGTFPTNVIIGGVPARIVKQL
jgi:acetyltransferase-like isoleucine patch superfamily enzyme